MISATTYSALTITSSTTTTRTKRPKRLNPWTIITATHHTTLTWLGIRFLVTVVSKGISLTFKTVWDAWKLMHMTAHKGRLSSTGTPRHPLCFLRMSLSLSRDSQIETRSIRRSFSRSRTIAIKKIKSRWWIFSRKTSMKKTRSSSLDKRKSFLPFQIALAKLS